MLGALSGLGYFESEDSMSKAQHTPGPRELGPNQLEWCRKNIIYGDIPLFYLMEKFVVKRKKNEKKK